MPYAVVTRDREGAAPYAAALAALGLDAIAMPVTRAVPPADPDALARAIARGGHAAIVCASARAAAAVARAAGGGALPPSRAAGREEPQATAGREEPQATAGRGALPPSGAAGREEPQATAGRGALPEVWAVGPATGRVLEAAGIPAIVPEGVRDGASLARALVAARPVVGRRVLVPRAEDGREEAIALLRAAGAEIEEVVAYRTVAAPAEDPALAEGRAVLAEGRAAICVVFAPSQVAALVALVGPGVVAALPFAAIGETTAAALRAAGAASVVIAAMPTPAGIASAVASVYPRRS